MCGITCVLSKIDKNISFFILQSLLLLQNRGYDSAGIMGFSINDNIIIRKYASTAKIDSLEKLTTSIKTIFLKSAIGHTRWATHGAKTDANAHPHSSMNNLFYIVHNGIIENYKSLKELLINNKYTFSSETDSEIISNLIEYLFLKQTTKDISTAITEACQMLEGTYGLAIICKETPDNIYIIRNGSPLIIAENETMIVATSESAGLANTFNHYMNIESNTLFCLSKKGLNLEKKNLIKLNKTDYELSPHPYTHWTLKEIKEQPDSLLRAVNNGGRIFDNNIKLGGIECLKPIVKDITNIILIGCGTSYNACMCAKYYFQKYANINMILFTDGAEFTELDIPKLGTTIVVLCSQSGETKDLHRCIKIAKNKQIVTVGVINVVDSLIAREVDCGIYLNARREVAVASTKSFSSMIMVLLLFSLWINQEKKTQKTQNNQYKIDIIDSIRSLPYQSCQLLKNIVFPEVLLHRLNKSSMFLLGKGKMESIAKEGALKIKEMCYIHAEGCNASSLKHGPFAMLENNFPVILLIDNENRDKMLNVYEEVKTRGAYICIITNIADLKINENKNSDIIFTETNQHCQEVLFIIVLQYLSYNLSIFKNINPDKPKNLAKVVTVE
jgi:glucosamine--fructose-6-phosphate aminotransferase (isomerizing)